MADKSSPVHSTKGVFNDFEFSHTISAAAMAFRIPFIKWCLSFSTSEQIFPFLPKRPHEIEEIFKERDYELGVPFEVHQLGKTRT